MRKFRNKKLVTVVVAFLMVFVMAGAFASFQALLRINARVNLYSPTVDAVIAEFAVTEQPLGMAANGMPVFRTTGTRFPNRLVPALATMFPDAGEALGAGLVHVENAWAFMWSNPFTGVPVGDVAIGGIAGNAPVVMSTQTGALPNPADFQSVYVVVNFDNFVQAYEFTYRLANVGLVPLRVDAVSVALVDVPEDDDFWHQFLSAVWDDYNDTADMTLVNDFVNITGTFNDLVGDILVSDTGVNFNNYSDPATIRFAVDMTTWEAWADFVATQEGLDPNDPDDEDAIALLLQYHENQPRSFTFRITHRVVPNL